MVPVTLLAVGIAIAVAVLGSAVFYIAGTGTAMAAIEERCRKIADEGYRIHMSYPMHALEELPRAEAEQIAKLDEAWMRECVAVLPADSILRIADNVRRDAGPGE